MMKTYRTGEFAEKVARSTRTVRRWTENGTVPDRRTSTGQRYFTDDDVRAVLGQDSPAARKVIVYCRVSSPGQKTDLASQVKAMKKYCKTNKLVISEFIEEVGGGMNFKRKKFLKLIDQIIAGEVSHVIIAHKDRLCRFGFELVTHIATTHGCQIVIANDDEKLNPQQELVDDLLAIVHTFSCRIYGMRRYSKKKKDAVAEAVETVLKGGDEIQ